MMEDTLSKTAQAKKLLLEFWSDFQPHSIHEFRDYLKKIILQQLTNPYQQRCLYGNPARHLGTCGSGKLPGGNKLS